MPDTGSGYGGKHTGETAIEAARLARATKKPVKVVWTRKEEFTWAYFRPAGVIDIRASVDSNGRLEYWEFTNFNSGGSGLGTPYTAEVRNEHFQPTKYPLRQGSYRGLAATAKGSLLADKDETRDRMTDFARSLDAQRAVDAQADAQRAASS